MSISPFSKASQRPVPLSSSVDEALGVDGSAAAVEPLDLDALLNESIEDTCSGQCRCLDAACGFAQSFGPETLRSTWARSGCRQRCLETRPATCLPAWHERCPLRRASPPAAGPGACALH